MFYHKAHVNILPAMQDFPKLPEVVPLSDFKGQSPKHDFFLNLKPVLLLSHLR